MKAILINDTHQLELTEIPIPAPAEDEILIKVSYAGINRPDIMQRKGLYPAPNTTPSYAKDIPGLEVSGEVIQIGGDLSTSSFQRGDKVTALVIGGGYAEYVCAKIGQTLPLPKGLTEAQAAALPENFFTVWSNIIDLGKLKKDEKILIHGGSSGIGTTAIQIAKSYGAEVFTTVGNAEKMALCKKLGADHVINYKTTSFLDEIIKITEGKGVDLILDIIAGDYVDKNLKALAFEGRLVMIAVQNGPKVTANILPIMLKRLTFTGSTLRAREDHFKDHIAQNLLTHIWPKLEREEITPHISKVFPLKDAQKAHKYLEGGENMGKILLKI